jgi:Ca2+-binding RTX toxin-like protein
LRDDLAALAVLNDPTALLAADPLLFQAYVRAVAETRGQGALHGASTGEPLVGLQSDDVITGGAGDELISGGLGNDIIDGGGGNDVLIVAGDSSSYRLLQSGDDFILKGPDGRDTLTNVERILFGDGRVLELNRIYEPQADGEASFDGRIPDGWLSDGPTDGERPLVLPGATDDFVVIAKGFDGPEVLPEPDVRAPYPFVPEALQTPWPGQLAMANEPGLFDDGSSGVGRPGSDGWSF